MTDDVPNAIILGARVRTKCPTANHDPTVKCQYVTVVGPFKLHGPPISGPNGAPAVVIQSGEYNCPRCHQTHVATFPVFSEVTH